MKRILVISAASVQPNRNIPATQFVSKCRFILQTDSKVRALFSWSFPFLLQFLFSSALAEHSRSGGVGGGEERKSDISFSPKHFIFQRLKYTEQMNPFPVLHSPPRSNSHCRFLVTKFFPILLSWSSKKGSSYPRAGKIQKGGNIKFFLIKQGKGGIGV